ncbi:MAG: protein kinase, partial [Planctomycetota bacterium]
MSEFPEMGRRYSRLEEIGRGGTGTVYRAHDELLDREVAIKVLHRSAGLDAADEFLFLASHDHPHLVRVFDFGRVDDRGYFTMELLGGRNLAEFVREEIGSPAGDEAEWLEILESLVGSLDYLHSRGVLHLDLKPENILVDRADERITLKLIDFGLSAGLGTERDGGTLEYTAPERLRGEEATPRSDLYSLGAVLYELVTGAPPFQAERREDLITQQIHTPAKPLQSSEPLAGVVRSLLEKDPADRPASADVVRRRLLPERESPSIAPAFSSVLVRRDTVDRIVELSQASRSVMVRGPRGAGKTRLLQEARIRLQILGRRLVAGDAPRAGEAGSALRHLLESLDRTIDSTALERLRALLGSLEKDANGLEGDELRESFAHSFASALIDLGRQESLTWMIDEIERVDSVSLETIRFTLRLSEHSDDAEISLVLASRDDDEVSRARSESLLTPSSRHLTTLRTGNFDPREVHEYLEALLPGADGLADISERLHQETGGHPFTVEEYLRDLAAGSLLIRDGTEWRLRDGAELPVPFRLEEYARRRLDQAPTSERHIVDWISLIGEAISSDELREILVRSGSRELVTLAARGELEARLGRSVLDQILRRDGALYGVPNEALRQASYRGIDERRRRKMHRS